MTPRVVKPLIYVAGPLNSSGDVGYNIRLAGMVGHFLIEEGFTPFIPHLTFYWNQHEPYVTEYWMSYDLEVVAHCDAVVRLPGVSLGADREEELANELGIPVFRVEPHDQVYSLNGLLEEDSYMKLLVSLRVWRVQWDSMNQHGIQS